MSTNSRTLQRRAAMLFVSGISADEICKQMNIRRDTLARWRNAPAFTEVLERFRHEQKQQCELSALAITTSLLANLHRCHERYGLNLTSFVTAVDILQKLFKDNELKQKTSRNQQKSARIKSESLPP